jgi:hypothetical protein
VQRFAALNSKGVSMPKPQNAQDRPAAKPSIPSGGRHEDEQGTNAVESTPDPRSTPEPNRDHKHVPRSPHVAGNQ